MILTCPNCATRYLVDPAAIGTDGRTVRCANCSHEWFEYAPADQIINLDTPVYEPAPEPEPGQEEVPSEEIALPPEPDLSSLEVPDEAEEFLKRKSYRSNLPAVVDEAGVPGSLIAAFFITLFIMLAIAGTVHHRSVMKYLPFTRDIYAVFGLYPVQGLMLTDVSINKLPSTENPSYEINCKVINTTQREQIIPGMLVSLIDKDGSIITQQKESSEEGKVIGAGGRVPCDQIKIELSKRSKDAERIRLDIGNAYDLFIRQ